MNFKAFIPVILSVMFLACPNDVGRNYKLNDIQVIGSHNSYKVAIEEPLWDYMYAQDSARAKSLQYGHIPIEEQLNLGLRNLELDVFHDPEGGRFSNPKGLDLVRASGKEPLGFDIARKLNQPGLKLFHVQDMDFRSHYLLFKDCLKAMKKWSAQHPDHTPIIVLMNTKDKVMQGLTDPLPFTKEAYDDLDNEILSVFSRNQLIMPDDVRGDHKTLEEAILTKGWPDLEASKGKFLFVLDEKEAKISRYLDGHPLLKGRVLFANSKEGNPEAAFRIINNPIKDFDYIQRLVDKGYMVRTRADAGTEEARNNDYRKFEKAKASGAQVISTDYYIPTRLFPSNFKISFEGDIYERIKE